MRWKELPVREERKGKRIRCRTNGIQQHYRHKVGLESEGKDEGEGEGEGDGEQGHS